MIYAIILLAISLSMDALGLGVSYGMKGVKVPLMPKILICFSSVMYALLGLVIGSWLLHILGMKFANIIGIVILLSMGIWMILKSRKCNGSIKEVYNQHMEQQNKLLEIAIKSIGITIMVVKNPVRGDIDNSGTIDIKEAILLGIALNMDAAAACVGTIMIGVSSLFIPFLIGVVQMFFLGGGLFIGRAIAHRNVLNEKLISVIPGLILITLGLIRILG